MEDSRSCNTFEGAIPRSLSDHGISSKVSKNNVCQDRGSKYIIGYQYPSQYIDESANQEAPSSQTIFESLHSTSTLALSNGDLTKDLMDAASSLSSGYFSTNSQSSQSISDVVDYRSQQDMCSSEGDPCTFLHRAQSFAPEGSMMRRIGKQTWRELSGVFRRARSSIGSSCRALLTELPTVGEGQSSMRRSVWFDENSAAHSPVCKKPRFTPSPSFFGNPSSEDADADVNANLDDTMPIDGGSDEIALSAVSPLSLSHRCSLDSDRKRSHPPMPPLINQNYLSQCASVPADVTQDRLNAFSGDFCSNQKASVLPIIERTGAGVNFISVNTVANLLTNKSTKEINFLIVDCRFPYEYNGGHVRSAVNLYTSSNLVREIFRRIPAESALEKDSSLYLGDQLDQMLMKENSNVRLPVVNGYVQSDYSSNGDGDESDDSIIVDDPLGEAKVDTSCGEVTTDSPSPPEHGGDFTPIDMSIDASLKPSHVIIFHCEFSSQRAPSMAKFLRRIDRTLNCNRYPYLFFPELYVMKGGYAEFYNRFPNLCEPREYMKMFHRSYRADLRYYRRLTKHVSVSCDACFRDSSLRGFTDLSGSENKENTERRLRRVHTMYSHKYCSPPTSNSDQQKLTFGDVGPTAVTVESDDDQYSKCVASGSETPSLLPGQPLDILHDSSLRLAEVIVRVGEHVTAAFEHGRRQSHRPNLPSIVAPSASGASEITAPYRQGPLTLTDSPPTPIRSWRTRLQPPPMPLSFSSSEDSGPNSPVSSKKSWLF